MTSFEVRSLCSLSRTLEHPYAHEVATGQPMVLKGGTGEDQCLLTKFLTIDHPSSTDAISELSRDATVMTVLEDEERPARAKENNRAVDEDPEVCPPMWAALTCGRRAFWPTLAAGCSSTLTEAVGKTCCLNLAQKPVARDRVAIATLTEQLSVGARPRCTSHVGTPSLLRRFLATQLGCLGTRMRRRRTASPGPRCTYGHSMSGPVLATELGIQAGQL
eukprot:3918737-Amphidinium_carterae.3